MTAIKNEKALEGAMENEPDKPPSHFLPNFQVKPLISTLGSSFQWKNLYVIGKLGIRHLQILLLFFGMALGYCLRVSLSEAIVAMTNVSKATDSSQVYNWTSSEKSMVLSSFFWGYTVMQIPSGYIAGRWSAKYLLTIGLTICGILNILIPIAARYGGLTAVCICRVGMGLTQSCLLPSTHTFLSKWAPPSERARLGTFAYAGGQFGTVISFPISGVIAGSSAGWQSIFYVFGALAICWSVVFLIFGSDHPDKDSRISEKEREFIENSLKTTDDAKASTNNTVKKIPWKAIFTSVPMWALIIVHCGQNWGYWTLITEMPSYMNSVLGFDIEKNGLMAALPYLVMWLLSFPMSWASDYALRKGVTKGIIRKVSNTIAHWGPGVALICLALSPVHDSAVAVAILVVAVGLNAGSMCGFQINHIDLSPNFAGTMMSITNCIASIIAIIAPLICGVIVSEETNASLWNIVFYISAAVYFLGNLVFIIFGQGEIQPWNEPESTEDQDQEQEKKESITA
ncbi:putative inorganic phosphate cotransporter [Calliopsis andreniformis]|uniref:putative inorganic phosphate cotransporter n=1 Tax=Calliopsis andreniformis TaxID=337506 RepID=UPI003FCEE375